MPIDPNIILQAKPAMVPQQDPVEQYGRMLTVQHLLKQGDLQDIQTQTARQGLESDQRLRALFGSNPNATPEQVMAIDPKTGIALRKSGLEAEKSRSDIDKNKAEIVTKATAAHRDQLANVNDPQAAAQWMAAGFNDPVLGPILKQYGSLDSMIAKIPTDPAAFQEWKQREALGATKFIEQNKPSIHMQTTGGASNVVSVPGLGGTPTTLSTTPMTATPGEVMTDARTRSEGAANRGVTVRGQNMADQRAQDVLEQGKTQVVTDADGNTTIVNKGTAVARPVLDSSGNPVKPNPKALTESQGKATGMALRATRANDILNTLEDAGETNRGIIKQGLGSLPLVGPMAEMGVNVLPGVMGGPSSNQQKVEQARRDFINAALRVESGASINPSEFANAERQYFPMPGDTAEVKAQKRQARQNEIDALRLQAGPGTKGITPAPKTPVVATESAAFEDAQKARKLNAALDKYK